MYKFNDSVDLRDIVTNMEAKNILSEEKSLQILKSINVPFSAYYNEEYFDIKNDDDQNFSFDPSTLVSSDLDLNTNDLVRIVTEQTELQKHGNLPQWRLDIASREINLHFDYSSNLLNDVAHPSESPGFITIEMEKRNIETLTNVSENTKRMILEKFYKGRKHPDLKKLSSDRTTYSGVLYELFSKIYKQKPVITIDEVADDSKHQKKFIAQHIFNDEILTFGHGTSKKVAKIEACKKSLEIFAPSLLIEVENHQKQLLMIKGEDEKINNLQSNLPQPLPNISLNENSELIKKDPFTEAVVSLYQEYSKEVSSLQMKENIDGSFQNPHESPTLLLFCQNQTFTKLHSIYELITYQRKPISLINFIQIGEIFHVYLHCPEIPLNFSHHSKSLEMSCEMVKYQCIFALYSKTCKSLSEILCLMKQDLEKKIQHCLEPLFLKPKKFQNKKPSPRDDSIKIKRSPESTNVEPFEVLQKKIHGESQIKGV